MPAWGPPQGDETQFSFTVAWGSPSGEDVAFAFDLGVQTVSDVTLGESSAYGSHTALADDTQRFYPSGFTADAYGTPAVSPGAATIYPPGANYGAVGGLTIYNYAQGASPGGIAPPPATGPNEFRQIPEPWVSFWTRTLLPTGIAAPTFPTTHAVTYEVQFVDFAGNGLHTWSPGNARIDFAVRYIAPPFIASNIFGTHNVARIQEVLPSGWSSSFISSNHELDINLQRVLHHSGSADPAGYGVAHVRNEFEVLVPGSVPPGAPGFPIVYNFDRYIAVAPYGNNTDPTQWPSYYPLVENKTRNLSPGGWQSSRFSVIGNLIYNNAVALEPTGLDTTLWGPDTFIAYRDRSTAPQGWDSFYSSQYTVVYNDAVVLRPTSWASSVAGTGAQLLNLNREIKQHSGWVGPVFGTPFVAPAVRTIHPGLFYAVPSGYPEVRFNPHPFAPTGWESYRTGGHDVREHFNIVFAPSVNVAPNPRVGEPIVENRNKTLYVFPSDQALYGLARVFNYNTHLTITAGDLSRWGAHLISYRTKQLVVAPISVPVFSVTHRIANTTPDPPARQLVGVPGIFIGNASFPGIVPSPSLNYATIFPDGIAPPTFGTPLLARNSIEPRSIVDLVQVGTPTFIGPQYCAPFGVPYPRSGTPGPDGSIGDSDLLEHEARAAVSPHTIYAPSSDTATEQARRNHPLNQPHIVDQYVFPDGNHFGPVTISNRLRTIGPVPTHSVSSFAEYGLPALTLRLQYVRPQPIRSLRTGLPVFLNVPQYVTFEWFGGLDSAVYGEATIGYVPVREMPQPPGLDATLWGLATVELLNREIAPQGIPHRGNPQEGFTNPWGTPLVGFPRVYGWGGYDFTLWGTARVEFKIRRVYPQGWDSYADTLDDLSGWSDRMRVRRMNPSGGLPGIPSRLTFGLAAISFANRTVFGRGISSYNGGVCSVKAVSSLLPLGWDSLEVGNIDEWEAGKVKPHGDDLSSMGTPRLLHPLRPTGVLDDVVAAPRVGVPIYVSGIPEIGFDGPSVSNPFGCTNRVVTPLPILPQQAVPQPVVA